MFFSVRIATFGNQITIILVHVILHSWTLSGTDLAPAAPHRKPQWLIGRWVWSATSLPEANTAIPKYLRCSSCFYIIRYGIWNVRLLQTTALYCPLVNIGCKICIYMYLFLIAEVWLRLWELYTPFCVNWLPTYTRQSAYDAHCKPNG